MLSGFSLSAKRKASNSQIARRIYGSGSTESGLIMTRLERTPRREAGATSEISDPEGIPRNHDDAHLSPPQLADVSGPIGSRPQRNHRRQPCATIRTRGGGTGGTDRFH